MDRPTKNAPLPDDCNHGSTETSGNHGSTETSGSSHGVGPWCSPFVEKLVRVFSPPARPSTSGSRSHSTCNGTFMVGTMPIAFPRVLSLNEVGEPSLSAKVQDWVIEKGLELFSEHILPPFIPRIYLPTLRTVEANSQPVLDHLKKISNSVRVIEGNSVESVRLLERIASAVSTAEGQVTDGVKKVKDSAGNDPEKPLPEGALSEFVNILRAVNNGSFAELLKELEKIVAMASVPINLKKQLIALKIEIQKFPWMMSSLAVWLTSSASKKLNSSKANLCSPASPSLLPRPTPVVPTASPPIPFAKFGKRASDLLYGGFIENRLHAEVVCGFKLGTPTTSNRSHPSLITKIKSEEFSLLMKHKRLFGDGVKGAISFVLPLGVTSLAKVQYLNEKFSLNAEMGLHVNPLTRIAASYKHQDLCVGGAVTFGARDGRITGAEAGVCASNPEWGILSGQAKLMRNPENGVVEGRAVKILYSQDFMRKRTVAVAVDYNYEDNSFFITGGLEHRVDDSMLLKARVRTDGAIACMVQFKEGMAGSTFRAMVQANLHALNKKPRVGFSISSDPMK